jgi:Co/Zn/Cd efflux system component
MSHEHAHGHSHGPSADADRRWLTIALALIASFMGVEVVVGIIASSLALLSDAAHMLTDAGSIALALFAVRLAARPPSRRYTFGLGRAEILSAQANGAALLVLAGVLAVEAVQRLFVPPDVEGGLVIIVGVLGGLVNVAAAYALSRSERRVWEVTSGFPALAAHVLVTDGDDCHARRRQLEQLLEARFEIEHTTLQVDHRRRGVLGLLAFHAVADARSGSREQGGRYAREQ